MNHITYDKDIFAANLLRLIKENHEKQIDIARLLGVSKSSVSSYCSGSQMPRMDKIWQVARHFGVPRSALIDDNSAPAAPDRTPFVRSADSAPLLSVYNALNDAGQAELLRYGRYPSDQPEYRAEE